MGKVLLGWVPSNSGTAVDGYIPFCDPPHHEAVRQLRKEMQYGLLHGCRGDTLWAYNPQDGSITRRSNQNLAGVSMLGTLGPVGQMVVNDRVKLEALLERLTPEMIAEDARTIIDNYRPQIRALLADDRTDRSMVDVVATVEKADDRKIGIARSDLLVYGEEWGTATVHSVHRQVDGLAASIVIWSENRLYIGVPGIPLSNPFHEWVDRNTERVDAVRRLVADMLSD